MTKWKSRSLLAAVGGDWQPAAGISGAAVMRAVDQGA